MATYARPLHRRSIALHWLRGEPAVRDAVRAHLSTDGKAAPDMVLEEPSRLIDAFNEAIVQAVTTNAPLGVLEELTLAKRRFIERGRGFDRNGYVAQQLRGLQGLRDRTEIGAALGRSLDGAPDDASRDGLRHLMSVASRELTFLPPDGLQTDIYVVSPPVDPPVDPGTPGPGPTTTRPPTRSSGTDVDPTTVDPGSTTRGGVSGSDGTPGERTGVTEPQTPEDELARLGADVGRQVGSSVGGGVEDQAAALGATYAVDYATHFDLGTIPAGSSDTASGRFWATIGGLVGFAIGGPVGAAVGYGLGAGFGNSGPGIASAQLIGTVFTQVQSTLDPGFDISVAVACVLCGPQCIPCVLAEEAGVPH